MLRIVRAAFGVALVLLLAGCGDPVERLKTAASLRSQIELAMGRIEAEGDVPGLQHGQVTVEPDSDVGGFRVKVYDVRVGDAKIGLQSFTEVTFSLAQSDATHFDATDFKFMPPPVTEGPKAAADTLVGQLKRAMSVLQSAS